MAWACHSGQIRFGRKRMRLINIRISESAIVILLALWPSLCSAARPVGLITGSGPVTVKGVVMDQAGVVSWTVLAGDDISTKLGPALLSLNSGGRVYLSANSRINVEDSIVEILLGKIFVICPAKDGRLTVIAGDHIVYTEASNRAEISVDSSRSVSIAAPGADPPKLAIPSSQLERYLPYIWGRYLPDEREISESTASQEGIGSRTFEVEPQGGTTQWMPVMLLSFAIVLVLAGLTLSRPDAAYQRDHIITPPSSPYISDPAYEAGLRRLATRTRTQEANWRVRENAKLYYPELQHRSTLLISHRNCVPLHSTRARHHTIVRSQPVTEQRLG